MGSVVRAEKEDRDESQRVLAASAGVAGCGRRSANKDGAPEKITDPETLAQVAQLLNNVY